MMAKRQARKDPQGEGLLGMGQVSPGYTGQPAPFPTELTKLALQPGDLVLVRLKVALPADEMARIAREVSNLVRGAGFPNQVLVLPAGLEIEALPEGEMAKFGWMRKGR